MNAIQKRRLLNVARALRESPAPKDFRMNRYMNSCGTPACALGHYAVRRDLQRTFTCVVEEEQDQLFNQFGLRTNYAESTDHFGITDAEAEELFSVAGCDNAKSAAGAARYIERFVVRKEHNIPSTIK